MLVFDAVLIYLSMMLISAISSAVKIAANIQNVSCTDDDGMPLIATPVGIRSCITQG